MSDDTMSTAASATALSARQPSTPGTRRDFASDTELILAAIARMETAVRDGRAIRDRLRIELESIAEAIAQVKTSLRNAATSGKPVNVNVLLTWLEVRVYSMRECLDPVTETAATAPAAEQASTPDIEPSQSDTVPTVSDVVSRLGRASDALEIGRAHV